MSFGNPVDFVQKIFDESIQIKAAFIQKNAVKMTEIAELIANRILQGNKVLVCGNGGSACDASHLTGEMLGRLSIERNALPAVCLTTDIGAITAIANDYGYHEVFARPLKGLSRPGDLLIAISTSGNSDNVYLAALEAHKLGVTTIGILGGNGGKIKPLCHHTLVVEEAYNSSRCQETYLVAIHALIELVDRFYLPINRKDR